MTTTALDTTMAAPWVTATAPAKINLTLDLLGRRDDAYHNLRSLVVGVDLRDRVRCRLIPDGEGVELTCNDPELQGDGNLVCRAVRAFSQSLGSQPSVRIELDKRIPVGAGLGGGSSDAATTLRICDELFKTGLGRRELAALGAEVGSDVPLFFFLPSAVITGRGEQVEPLTLRWSGWALLVFPDVKVSTAQVYRAWRASDTAHRPREADRDIAAAKTADEVSALLSNHLEPAVFRVCGAVGSACDELHRAGVGRMRVTGTGSTLYRLFDEKETACQTARRIENFGLGLTSIVVAAPVGPDPVVGEES